MENKVKRGHTTHNHILDMDGGLICPNPDKYFAGPQYALIGSYVVSPVHVLAIAFLAGAVICGMLHFLLPEIPLILAILGIIGGLATAALLAFEAMTIERTFVVQVGLFAASFILCIEIVLVLLKLLSR